MSSGQANAEIGIERRTTLNCLHEAPIVARSLCSSDGGIDREDRHTLVTVAFAQNSRDEVRLQGGDGQIVGALAAEPGMKQTTYIAQPYTLAIRGRGDSHNLEYRHDGTANALLTPNGGRGWIGVGAVAFKPSHFTRGKDGAPNEIVPPLSADADKGDQDTVIHSAMQVRRLTPKECCRLQGFPDDYLDVMFRGKPAADGPRYKALGNSMAVPCMVWLGKRIQMVEEIGKRSLAA